MRFAMNILTPLAAFCLIGTAYECSAQEENFDRAIVEKATEESPVADNTLLAVHCDKQTEDPRLAHVSTPSKGTQSGSEALQPPIFLKQPLLFTPNGFNLTARSRNNLHCAVAWLREHHVARVLIVGYCDNSGSEACTAALAKRRAEVVRQFLVRFDTQANQIAGVKGWQNLDRPCRAGTTECQRQNRSARLFLAGPAGSLN
jgi:outer membrane protein OmpA-like peptidoglycan-associated protein